MISDGFRRPQGSNENTKAKRRKTTEGLARFDVILWVRTMAPEMIISAYRQHVGQILREALTKNILAAFFSSLVSIVTGHDALHLWVSYGLLGFHLHMDDDVRSFEFQYGRAAASWPCHQT